jgi:hypothetical protein
MIIENNNPLTTKLLIVSIDGRNYDKFGELMNCLPKYSNCQLCKYTEMPQNSDVCTYCSKYNKSTEYYR